MSKSNLTGRVTIPTDLDVVPETLEIMKRWGADAIRDCDGTDFPAELQNQFFGQGGIFQRSIQPALIIIHVHVNHLILC